MGNVMRKGDKNSDWKHLIPTKVCFHTRKCHKSKDKDKHMISLRLLTMIDEVQQLLAPCSHNPIYARTNTLRYVLELYKNYPQSTKNNTTKKHSPPNSILPQKEKKRK